MEQKNGTQQQTEIGFVFDPIFIIAISGVETKAANAPLFEKTLIPMINGSSLLGGKAVSTNDNFFDQDEAFDLGCVDKYDKCPEEMGCHGCPACPDKECHHWPDEVKVEWD